VKNSIDSDNVINLEIEGQTASEELSFEVSENESESETSAVRIDGWEGMTMINKKPKAYTFTKMAGPQFTLLPDTEPMDSFILFFNDELLNNIVIETNRYKRHKISELQLSLWSVWSTLSDVSVPEVKSF
jgi:hypothetical protein